MEINGTNGVSGVNAYSANSLYSERNQVENQNQGSAQSDVTPRDARSAQQAFEVNISQEARQLSNGQQPPTGTSESQTGRTAPGNSAQATNQTENQNTPQAASQPPAPGVDQSTLASQQARQIVNIVA